jgi:Zn-dependent protease with chaperone function
MWHARCGMLGLWMALAVTAGHAVELAYEPVALGWTTDEVERATAGTYTSITQRAAAAQQLGCLHHCERLQRIFARLVTVARGQTKRSQNLPWSLTVVRLPDVDALALPGGQVIVSEAFIDRHALDDDALAFVLAHEIAHCILEHERQVLTFARMLLPRDVPRSVRDMYTEMDFNFGLLMAMEPVMHQGEFEADELGLLLASVAGFAPRRQLAFIEGEVAAAGRRPLLSTHPTPQARLDRLRAALPLAERLLNVAGP